MERVPPAVSLNFERLVLDVCNRARLDFDDWPLEARELLNHLENRWREGIEMGLSTGAAEERAVALFGDVKQVARSLRAPWLRRMLFYRRYRAERYFAILASVVINAWMCLAIILIELTASGTAQSLNARNLFGILSASTQGITCLFCIRAIRWTPETACVWLRRLLSLRYLLGVIVLSTFVNLPVTPFVCWYGFPWSNPFGWVDAGFLAMHLGMAPLGLLAAACILSETLGWPENKQREPRITRSAF